MDDVKDNNAVLYRTGTRRYCCRRLNKIEFRIGPVFETV